MPLHIKNWKKFQHFKDRRPPWVKLYRDLLDDMEWHQLEPRAAKALVMLWLIASESDGQLPEAKALAFRLRTSVDDVESILLDVSHWLTEGPDIAPSPDGYQGDAPETEEEKRRERDRQCARDFATFYTAYPKKEGKAPAEKAFAKVDVAVQVLLDSLERQKRSANWRKDDGRYIPLPATWLNQRRWEDQGTTVQAVSGHTDSAEETRRMLDERNRGTATMPPELRAAVAQLTGRKAA